VREEIANACNEFVKSDLADTEFTKELCSGSEQKYWSCVSEALLAARLRNVGLNPAPSHGGGPDFLLIEKERKIWIEVICPEPKGVPLDWLNSEYGKVINFPHEQILLRWTSAIKEKAEKLIGDLDGTNIGYIKKGIVALEDAYVIAVNGRQMRNGSFPTLLGISQFPFAVEAVFAIGPYQISINRNTLKQTGAGHQHRPLISKRKGAQVATYTFLDERFQSISAIWAVDVDGTSAIGNPEPMAVIHNPNANNPIPIGLLPAHDEYVATPIGMEEFKLNKVEGRLESQ
jgi:type I restriction enzyme S subunit